MLHEIYYVLRCGSKSYQGKQLELLFKTNDQKSADTFVKKAQLSKIEKKKKKTRQRNAAKNSQGNLDQISTKHAVKKIIKFKLRKSYRCGPQNGGEEKKNPSTHITYT